MVIIVIIILFAAAAAAVAAFCFMGWGALDLDGGLTWH
jgi:hypothetical protein